MAHCALSVFGGLLKSLIVSSFEFSDFTITGPTGPFIAQTFCGFNKEPPTNFQGMSIHGMTEEWRNAFLDVTVFSHGQSLCFNAILVCNGPKKPFDF